MEKPIETLYISEKLQAATYPDYYSDGPFDWGVIKVETLRHSRDINPYSSSDEHAAAVYAIREHNPETGGTYASGWSTTARDEWEREAITKHFTRAGQDCYFLQLSGCSQSEWADVVIYTNAGDVTDWNPIAREVNAWFSGQVYTLALEELVTYTAANGSTIERWETVDTVGGVYLLNGFTLDAVKEYLDIDAALVAA
jgi:hypothetical protein